MKQDTPQKFKAIQDLCRDIARLQTWGDVQSNFYCKDLSGAKDTDDALAIINKDLSQEKQLLAGDLKTIGWSTAWVNIHDALQYDTDGEHSPNQEDAMMEGYEKQLKVLLDALVGDSDTLYSFMPEGITKLAGFHPTWWGFGFLVLNSNDDSFLLCSYGYE